MIDYREKNIAMVIQDLRILEGTVKELGSKNQKLEERIDWLEKRALGVGK